MNKGKSGLTLKVALIVSAAIAAIGLQKSGAASAPALPAADNKNIDYAQDTAKPKKCRC